MVDAAVKDGRIKEVQREVYLNLLKADPVNGEGCVEIAKAGAPRDGRHRG